jgi:hypothetical protein
LSVARGNAMLGAISPPWFFADGIAIQMRQGTGLYYANRTRAI